MPFGRNVEKAVTRMELNYQEVVDRESGEPTGKWVCYVRVHMRGIEGAISQGVFGNQKVKENTERLRERLGVK